MNQAATQVLGARSSPGATGEQMSATLCEERQAIFQRLLGGAPPGEVVAGFTDFVDGLIAGRYREDVLLDAAAVIEAAGTPPSPVDPA